MEKKIILLLLSLLGISILVLLTQILQPQTLKISQIQDDLINQNIKLEARITKATFLKDSNFNILQLQDKTGNITAVFSSNNKPNLTIYNKTYIIIGKIQEYNRTLQLSVDKILEK